MGGSCETLTMFSDCACWVCGVQNRWKWRRILWTWSCWRSRVLWLFSRWSSTWSTAWSLPKYPSSKLPSKVSKFAKLRPHFAFEISTIAVKIWYFGRSRGIQPVRRYGSFPVFPFASLISMMLFVFIAFRQFLLCSRLIQPCFLFLFIAGSGSTRFRILLRVNTVSP